MNLVECTFILLKRVNKTPSLASRSKCKRKICIPNYL
jgi:hypothetical protein